MLQMGARPKDHRPLKRTTVQRIVCQRTTVQRIIVRRDGQPSQGQRGQRQPFQGQPFQGRRGQPTAEEKGRPPYIKWGFMSRTTVSRTARTTVPRSRTTVSTTTVSKTTKVKDNRLKKRVEQRMEETCMYPPTDCWGLACIEWKLAQQTPNSVERSSAGVPPCIKWAHDRRTTEGQRWNIWRSTDEEPPKVNHGTVGPTEGQRWEMWRSTDEGPPNDGDPRNPQNNTQQ